MVKIRKGSHVLTVTNGAFKRLYAPMGYVVMEGEEDVTVLPPSDEVNTTPPGNKDDDEDLEDTEDDSDLEDEADEEDDDEDLKEKPIGEMSFKELQQYASDLGLNVKGMTSKKEIRQAIRVYLAEA